MAEYSLISRVKSIIRVMGYGVTHEEKLIEEIKGMPFAKLLTGEKRIDGNKLLQLHVLAFDIYDENAPIYTNTVCGPQDKYNAISAQKFFIQCALNKLLEQRTNFN